jgi:hypothetical protein
MNPALETNANRKDVKRRLLQLPRAPQQRNNKRVG